jgi:hypothetical protein
MNDKLLSAIQFAYENDIWPSAKNIATLLGYKQAKLTGRANRERKLILRTIFGL